MSIHLFEAYGVELEYMIVDRDSLRVAPIADQLLLAAAAMPGATVDEEEDADHPGTVELGAIGWSNELTLHVVEFKTGAPAASLRGLAGQFHENVTRANELLAPHNARLLPGGAHPLMDPDQEMKLWPHGYSEVYGAFNRIFDCRGHGWANLQSAHLNLPFSDAEEAPGASPEEKVSGEFGRLHAAIRFLLPIMPALTASSPIMDGAVTGLMDSRLEVYRQNARKLPIVSGRVVPEAVFSRADYERVVLGAIYEALKPHDPTGLLQHEWANSRGAIARFDRSTIEVRVLDVQECPACDLAILAAITSVLRAMVEGRLGDLAELRRWDVDPLHRILLGVIRDGEEAEVIDTSYLRALGFQKGSSCRAKDLWKHLVEATLAREESYAEFRPVLDLLFAQGCLSRRILRACGTDPTPDRIVSVYRMLAECLAANTPFESSP